ncbi:MAG: hypothetical protein H7336_03525 [Bacteriovorax sp.]|nr:hypothetical protein [Bacteriovorax sp.]
MKYLILSMLVLSTSAHAADSKMKSTTKNIVKSESTGTMDIDPKNKTEEMADQTATLSDKDVAKMYVTCKAKDGHEMKQGDTGYEDCLKKVKSDKKNSKDPKADVDVKFEK